MDDTSKLLSVLKELSDHKLASKVSEDIVKLNVGGTVFTTLKATLMSQSNSILTRMLSGKYKIPRDEQGYIFIDRDPGMFSYILSYMRDPYLFDTFDLDVSTSARLVREFQYYGIEYNPCQQFDIPNPFCAFNIAIKSSKEWDIDDNAIKFVGNLVYVLGSRLVVYDVRTGSTKQIYKESIDCFDVDTNYLFIYNSERKRLKIIELETGVEHSKDLGTLHPIVRFIHLGDWNFMVVTDQKMAGYLTLTKDSMQIVDVLQGAVDNQLNAIENTNLVLIGGKNGSLFIWDSKKREFLYTLKTIRLLLTGAKAIKNYVISFGQSTTRIYMVHETHEDEILAIHEAIYDAVIEGDLLVTVGDRGVRAWCLSTGEFKAQLDSDIEWNPYMVSIFNNRILVVGDGKMASMQYCITL